MEGQGTVRLIAQGDVKGALAGGDALAEIAMAAGSEAYMANVDADGKRTAEEIVKKALGPFFVSQGWIPQIERLMP